MHDMEEGGYGSNGSADRDVPHQRITVGTIHFTQVTGQDQGHNTASPSSPNGPHMGVAMTGLCTA